MKTCVVSKSNFQVDGIILTHVSTWTRCFFSRGSCKILAYNDTTRNYLYIPHSWDNDIVEPFHKTHYYSQRKKVKWNEQYASLFDMHSCSSLKMYLHDALVSLCLEKIMLCLFIRLCTIKLGIFCCTCGNENCLHDCSWFGCNWLLAA